MHNFASVLGPVPSSELGVVLPHEHVLVDFSRAYVEGPPLRDGSAMRDLKLTVENMGVIRRYP